MFACITITGVTASPIEALDYYYLGHLSFPGSQGPLEVPFLIRGDSPQSWVHQTPPGSPILIQGMLATPRSGRKGLQIIVDHVVVADVASSVNSVLVAGFVEGRSSPRPDVRVLHLGIDLQERRIVIPAEARAKCLAYADKVSEGDAAIVEGHLAGREWTPDGGSARQILWVECDRVIPSRNSVAALS